MDDAQLATYSADIAANTDPTVIAALAAGNHQAITDWYNQTATPDFWILKSSVTRLEMVGSMDWPNEYETGFKDDMQALIYISDDGTGSGYDPRTVGARDALNTIFSGAPNSKQAILDVSVWLATYVRKLFAEATTGPGGGDGSAKAQAALDMLNADATLDDTRAAVALI